MYASAHETKLENRNPSVGKVHVQNHAAPDKAPFFVLKPFRLMVLGTHGPVAILRAGVILETHNETTKKKLEKYLPRIYSCLLNDFHALTHLLWESDYHTDLMALKKRVERLVHTIVGKDLVSDVLVQKAFIKPLPKTRESL